MTLFSLRRFAVVPLVLLGLSCDPTGPLCTSTAQCPTGEVCADGRCSPQVRVDHGAWDQRLRDRGMDGLLDAVTDRGRLDGDQGLACTPDNDGQVERDEVRFTVPSQVSVTRGTKLWVNLKGQGQGANLVWDLTASATDDVTMQVKLEAIPAWAAPAFPQAQYASTMSVDYGLITKVDLLGVFAVTSSALQLVGAVSDKPHHTQLVYAQPVDLLRFPAASGDSFSTEAVITGITEYMVAAWLKERYTVDVLGHGQVKLLSNFAPPALLVRVRQEVAPVANPLLKSTTTVFLFLSECYGTVAHLTAAKDPGIKLDSVEIKERWRLSAP